MCDGQLDEFGILVSRCDDLLLGLNAIVLVMSILNIILCKDLHQVLGHCVCVFDLKTHRDEFNAALNAYTELLRDNCLFDCRSEIACEGFATKACVEIFSFDWTGVWRP